MWMCHARGSGCESADGRTGGSLACCTLGVGNVLAAGIDAARTVAASAPSQDPPALPPTLPARALARGRISRSSRAWTHGPHRAGRTKGLQRTWSLSAGARSTEGAHGNRALP
eukprot:2818608-Prymnesium_polylepis.2